MPSYLTYTLEEIDADELAEWEATQAPEGEDKGPAPEAKEVDKTIEIDGEARLVVTTADGYKNLSIGPGGITKIEVSDEAPEGFGEPEAEPKKAEPKAAPKSSDK